MFLKIAGVDHLPVAQNCWKTIEGEYHDKDAKKLFATKFVRRALLLFQKVSVIEKFYTKGCDITNF